MEPFFISCTTCKSRLKVHDQAVIGEILSCPKCGSMVLVQAPAERWRQPDEADQPLKQTVATSAHAVGSLSNTPPANASTSDREYPATYVATTPPPLPQAEPPKPDNQETAAVLPGSQWYSAATRRRLMVAAGALVGVVMAIGMFAIVIAFSGNDSRPKQVPSAGKSRDDGERKVADNDVVRSGPSEEDDTDNPQDTDASKVDDKLPADSDTGAGEPPATTERRGADPLTEPKDDGSPTSDMEDESPPGFEPGDAVADASGGNPRSLLKDLEAFGEILDDVGFEFSDSTSDESPGPADITNDEPPLDKPPPRTVDVEARLADKFLGIQFKDVPLAAYLQDLSDLSTIPLTMQPEALAWAKISPDELVSVHLTDAKVSDMLRAVLEPFNLAAVATEGHVRITWPNTGLREVEYEVDDLTAGDPVRLAQLQTMGKQLVVAKSWKEMGGPGTITANGNLLAVNQSEAVHYKLLVFFEKLRVARGLPPRSSYDAERFQVATRHERAQPMLNTPISMNYIQPARLVEILQRIHQDTKTHVLVDWQAIGEIGWTPETEVPFSADEEPLGEALLDLLRRMDLAYRIVAADVLQITTPQVLAERTEFEVYPAGDLLSEELDGRQLVDGLKTALGAPHFFDGAGAMIYDPPSASLLVTLPQPQQLALAKLLDNLRSGKEK